MLMFYLSCFLILYQETQMATKLCGEASEVFAATDFKQCATAVSETIEEILQVLFSKTAHNFKISVDCRFSVDFCRL